jgi:hypothetical protein
VRMVMMMMRRRRVGGGWSRAGRSSSSSSNSSGRYLHTSSGCCACRCGESVMGWRAMSPYVWSLVAALVTPVPSLRHSIIE